MSLLQICMPVCTNKALFHSEAAPRALPTLQKAACSLTPLAACLFSVATEVLSMLLWEVLAMEPHKNNSKIVQNDDISMLNDAEVLTSTCPIAACADFLLTAGL